MKKFYATFLCLCAVAALYAQSHHEVKSAREFSQSPESSLIVKDHSKAVMKAPESTTEFENESKWEEMGECTYTDDIVTTCWSTGTKTYNVRVQKDVANEGVYRIVDPWANYPARAAVENHEDYPGVLPVGDEYYILIDARDPERVRIPKSHIGMSNHRGEYTLYSQSELVGRYRITQEQADAALGKLVDGVISFPVRHALYLLTPDEDYWLGNKFGGFKLVLTGGTIPVDYEFNLNLKQDLCADSNGQYQFQILGDENIPFMKYKVIDTWPGDDVSIYDVIENGKNCYPGQIVTVDTNQFTKRCMWVMFVACDQDGYFKTARYIDLYAPHVGNADWKPLGKADFTEGFLSCLLPDLFDVKTFEVDVEYNVNQPGYYRIVEPYASFEQAKSYLTYGHAHKHYIYINASKPDKVYIETSPLGLEVLHLGELAISCDYSQLLDEWDEEFLEMMGITESGGHIKDNVITFDERAGVMLFFSQVGWYYTNCFVNPDYDKEAADAALAAGVDYPVLPYTPGYFKLDLNKAMGGVDNVSVDNEAGEAEYYNLQGVKVENPENGLFIRRQGGKAEKVFVK